MRSDKVQFIQIIQRNILSLDAKKFYQYLGIFWLILLVSLGITLGNYYATVRRLYAQVQSVNKLRERTRTMLQKNEEVKQQQEEVDTVLTQEPNFKIVQYMGDVLREAQLTALLSRDMDISEADLDNGYVEIKLSAHFSQLNMKQVTELLDKIRQNIRVYTKELKIIKNVKSAMVDITLVIATLQAKKTAT